MTKSIWIKTIRCKNCKTEFNAEIATDKCFRCGKYEFEQFDQVLYEMANQTEKLNHIQRLQQENQSLKQEIKELNRMLDDAHVLRGKDAEKFEEYANRKPTQKEINDMKECDEIYKKCDAEQIEITRLKQLQKRIEDRIKTLIPIRNDYTKLGMYHDFSPLQADTIIKELQQLLDSVDL